MDIADEDVRARQPVQEMNTHGKFSTAHYRQGSRKPRDIQVVSMSNCRDYMVIRRRRAL